MKSTYSIIVLICLLTISLSQDIIKIPLTHTPLTQEELYQMANLYTESDVLKSGKFAYVISNRRVTAISPQRISYGSQNGYSISKTFPDDRYDE